MRSRIVFRRGSAMLAGLLAVPVPALAASGAEGPLEEIVVTATRRAASLQDTGATISALSAEQMQRRSIESLLDFSQLTPGLHVAEYQTETSIFIRGIGTPAIVAGNDSSTATYVDGIYHSRAAAIGPAFFDLERVEVLRGPQGTLYGRNATGGAVNLVPRKPSAQLEEELQASFGNHDSVLLSGAVGGPLSERVRARLAGRYERHDGYTQLDRPAGSTLKDDDVEDREDVSLRGSIELDVGADTLVSLTGDYYRRDDQASVFHFASAGYAEEIPGWRFTREGSATLPYFAMKAPARASAAGSRTLYSDVDYDTDTEIWGVTGRVETVVAGLDAQVSANVKHTNPSLHNEFDLSDAFINVYQRAEDHDQWSVDFQLTSAREQRLRWVAGGYYFEEDNVITNNIFGDFWEPILVQGLTDLQNAGVIPVFPVNIPPSPYCCDLHLNGEQETEAWAAYVEASVDLTERLVLILGGRYSEEQRDGRQAFDLTVQSPTGGPDTRFAPNEMLFPNAVTNSRADAAPDPFGFIVAPVDGPAQFDALTPKLGLEFHASDSLLVYATIQEGFKSGGYNVGSSQRTPFKPEEIWAYEAGVKSDLADGRLRMNGAAFYYDYSNLQAQDSIQNQPIIRNVGEAAVAGVELELAARLSDRLQIDGSVSYLDAEFTEGALTEPLRPAPAGQPPGTLVRDLDGLRLPRAPRWKYNLGAASAWPLGNAGEVRLRVDYAWQSKVYYTVFNIDAASEDAYGLVNARLEYQRRDSGWTVALHGKNLTDETYFLNQILTGSFYGAEFVGSLGAPRTYGLEFRWSL